MNVSFNIWEQLNLKYNLRYQFLDPDQNPQKTEILLFIKWMDLFVKQGKPMLKDIHPLLISKSQNNSPLI